MVASSSLVSTAIFRSVRIMASISDFLSDDMSSILIRSIGLSRVVEESGLSRLIWDEGYVGSNPTYSTNGTVAK